MVNDPDGNTVPGTVEEQAVPGPDIAIHAVLLLAELGVRPPQVQQDLAVAVAELTRHQTVEMP